MWCLVFQEHERLKAVNQVADLKSGPSDQLQEAQFGPRGPTRAHPPQVNGQLPGQGHGPAFGHFARGARVDSSAYGRHASSAAI